MRMFPTVLASTLLLGIASASAHEPAPTSTRAAAAMADSATSEVIAVAERFGAALKAADMATVSRLLDERVLILESGGAERSRDEYGVQPIYV